MQIINVDLVPGKVMPILHASQFDKGRSLGVKLYNGGAVFELSGAEDLTAAVRKPDGNIVTETLTNAGGSLVEIITTEQMTACAGGSLCEIKIENAGDVIGTANFVLDVEEDPTNGGIESESGIDNLATQVAGLVASEVENQYDSANVIFDDEPTEGHGNGYTVTSEGIRNAIDNATYMTDTASGAIATFKSEYALPLHNLEIEINAVQSGSGTPSPDNVRPISGFTGANIHVADDETPHVIDNVTAISWQSEAGTVYGGSLDVTSGVLTVTHRIIDLGSNNWSIILPTATIPDTRFYCNALKDVIVKPQSTVVASGCCDVFTIVSDKVLNATRTTLENVLAIGSDGYIYVRNNDYSDANAFKTAMSGHKLVYELATPITYQLTPTQISAIVGTNNVFTDTNGDTSLEYYTNKTVKDAINEVNDKADTNTTAIGSLSSLTTTDKSSLVGAVNEVDKSLDFQTAKSVKFQVASGRLLIYLYTDDAKANGMRIDFDSSANVIELSSITNGTTTPTNRITFPHV